MVSNEQADGRSPFDRFSGLGSSESKTKSGQKLGSGWMSKAFASVTKGKLSSGHGLLSKFGSGSGSASASDYASLTAFGKGSRAGHIGPADTDSVTASCCSQLSQTLEGKVNTQLDPLAYRKELTTYWATQNREVSPSCFVLPSTTEDVSTILKILNAANEASPKSCQFAVRSGGHTPIGRWNNIEDGVTIDLSRLNQVKISGDRQTVAIGPGNRWGDVYTKLDANNLATTGGRVASVGVGGLLTGGGISFFTPRYGLACDNVKNFEVVLANGGIVHANNATNPDLFRALKGGSSNFGIVTRFDMATFDQGPFYGGLAFLKTAARGKIFNWFEQFPKVNDPYAHIIVSFTFAYLLGVTVPVSTANFQYTQPNLKPAIFQPLLANAISNTGRISTHGDFTNEIKNLNPDDHRQIFMSFSHQNSAQFMEEVYTLSQAGYNRIKASVPGIQWSTSFQPLSSRTLAKSALWGGNSLGLEDAPDTTIVLLTVTWSKSTSDKTVEMAAKSFYNEVESAAKAANKFSRFIYLNYAADFQDPISRYGPESAARLTAASRKYDPKGIFQTKMPGGFKVRGRQRAASQRHEEPEGNDDEESEDSD